MKACEPSSLAGNQLMFVTDINTFLFYWGVQVQTTEVILTTVLLCCTCCFLFLQHCYVKIKLWDKYFCLCLLLELLDGKKIEGRVFTILSGVLTCSKSFWLCNKLGAAELSIAVFLRVSSLCLLHYPNKQPIYSAASG